MKVYHRTRRAAAQAILAGGFIDAAGAYVAERARTGVWFSQVPLAAWSDDDGALLEVDLGLADDELAAYEWVGMLTEARRYRAWLIPAAVVNGRGRGRVMSDAEEDAIAAAWRDLRARPGRRRVVPAPHRSAGPERVPLVRPGPPRPEPPRVPIVYPGPVKPRPGPLRIPIVRPGPGTA